MAIGFGDLRRGMAIELDGDPYRVEEFEHSKMQHRAPVIGLKLRDLRSGQRIERSFQGYKIQLDVAPVQNRPSQYIYKDDSYYYFMDSETFEQYPLSREQLGDSVNYLTEQAEVELVFHRDNPIAVEMPTAVELKVVETPPAFKGNTAAGGTKPATLETGITVQVPLFISPGEKVKIDTRTGQYLERVG